jgi:hypothetical protein
MSGITLNCRRIKIQRNPQRETSSNTGIGKAFFIFGFLGPNISYVTVNQRHARWQGKVKAAFVIASEAKQFLETMA